MKTFIIAIMITFISTASSAEWNPNKQAIATTTKAQAFDVATTILGISTETVVEANPIGLAVLPLKLVSTYGVNPLLPGNEQIDLSKRISVLSYGAGISNIGTIAGLSFAAPIGVASGLYVHLCNERVLPNSMCPFAERVSVELDRRIELARKRGADLSGFILTYNEAQSLREELGFIPKSWKGKFIQVQKRLICELEYDKKEYDWRL